jgi:hypothetical protein
VPILDKNPLRTVKYFDYLDFKKVLSLLIEAKTTAVIGTDKELAINTIKGKNQGRINYDIHLIPREPVNKY